jgi:hypothetical protein
VNPASRKAAAETKVSAGLKIYFPPYPVPSASPLAVPSFFMPMDRFDLAARSARLVSFPAVREARHVPSVPQDE